MKSSLAKVKKQKTEKEKKILNQTRRFDCIKNAMTLEITKFNFAYLVRLWTNMAPRDKKRVARKKQQQPHVV